MKPWLLIFLFIPCLAGCWPMNVHSQSIEDAILLMPDSWQAILQTKAHKFQQYFKNSLLLKNYEKRFLVTHNLKQDMKILKEEYGELQKRKPSDLDLFCFMLKMGNSLANKSGCPPVDMNFFSNKNINLFIFQGYDSLESLLQDLASKTYVLQVIQKHPGLSYILMVNFNYYLLRDFLIQSKDESLPKGEAMAYYRRNLFEKGLPSSKKDYYVRTFYYHSNYVTAVDSIQSFATGKSGEAHSYVTTCKPMALDFLFLEEKEGMAYVLVNIHSLKDIQKYKIASKGFKILVEAPTAFNDAIQLISIPREMLATEHVQIFTPGGKDKWDYTTRPIQWFYGLSDFFYQGSPTGKNLHLTKEAKANIQKACR